MVEVVDASHYSSATSVVCDAMSGDASVESDCCDGILGSVEKVGCGRFVGSLLKGVCTDARYDPIDLTNLALTVIVVPWSTIVTSSGGTTGRECETNLCVVGPCMYTSTVSVVVVPVTAVTESISPESVFGAGS